MPLTTKTEYYLRWVMYCVPRWIWRQPFRTERRTWQELAANLTFNPVELALKKHGFNLVRQSDRHRIFKKQRYHGHGVLAGRG